MKAGGGVMLGAMQYTYYLREGCSCYFLGPAGQRASLRLDASFDFGKRGVAEIRVPYRGPDYAGILLVGGLYEGSLVFVNLHKVCFRGHILGLALCLSSLGAATGFPLQEGIRVSAGCGHPQACCL